MNAVTPITAATPSSSLPEPPPVVLRFDGLHPGDLGRVRMHDKRTGGDLSHVDPKKTGENRVEFGAAGWIETLRFEIARASRSNFENHIVALDKKSRKKEILAVKDAGLQDPWRRCKHGPLREGILTVTV
ncbi:hypothetical protein [Falsirhodobacter sp. 20TX0035]|uniref:hypothetical protein n=1 Tax=Falsirhodobacter sp. 20TX0035 TaxID=3022019 RepID=UPI0023307F5E|nr:hypothetical protein [Falsirhodobacter sp. 20TX0035]MDB6455205.1 hypothetical protein [Falsirhodobacter sp. 20TX0035]